MRDVLAYLVTALGAILSLSVIALIAFGKRIGSPGDGPQELEYKGLRLKTNVVNMMLAVAIVPLVLPIVLNHLKDQASPVEPGVTMVETWTFRGMVAAEDADISRLMLQPEAIEGGSVNADGSFSAKVPVKRERDGKLVFPTIVVEHPGFRRENIDLQMIVDGHKPVGNRDFAATVTARTIQLGKPIPLIRKPAPVALAPVAQP